MNDEFSTRKIIIDNQKEILEIIDPKDIINSARLISVSFSLQLSSFSKTTIDDVLV